MLDDITECKVCTTLNFYTMVLVTQKVTLGESHMNRSRLLIRSLNYTPKGDKSGCGSSII